jgi:flagellar hook assembly protein FlgD
VRVGLLGVRPNPSGAGFVLGYYAAAERGVQLEVLDVSGRVVRRILATGVEGEVLWDGLDDRGKEVSPGVYFARLVAKERAIGRTEKLVIVR